MDVSDLLDSLNDKQRDAVAAPRSNMLVLAGAGSGKTRVLVHRIAWLMSVENCSPYSIMAVTFTNKAAAEMRHRIEQLIGTSQGGMWIGTFHGLAHRLLRAHHLDAGLPQDFQILDSEDQLRLLKRLVKALNLDDKQWPPRQAMWYINGKKDEGLRPQHIESYGNPVEQTWLRVYQAYQEACDRAGLVDFAELLLRAHELWLNKPHILQHYRSRFNNILVDEFQDTNRIQYAWVRMLAGDSARVMIVGDDDQSIYGWRGAQVENIQHFLNDFPQASTIRLEQNYRSSANILNAANALIAHNGDRLGKNLWTDGVEGDPISLYCAFNELDEARFVVSRIKAWQEMGLLDRLQRWARKLGLSGATVRLFSDKWRIGAPSDFTHLALNRTLFEPLRIQRLGKRNHYLGSLNGPELLMLLPQARQVGSVALSLMGEKGDLGLLIFSSRDSHHYQEGMGTVLLQHLATILPMVLQRWIERL